MNNRRSDRRNQRGSEQWHIAVLIPARNEEDLLPRCLHSVLTACSLLPPAISSDIVVAVDSSIDKSLRIAKRMLRGKGKVVSTQAGAVGSARALAAETALHRYKGPLQQCWLANTDADCCVPPCWLNAQLLLAQSAVEAVAGVVDVDSFAEHDKEVKERFRTSYLIHPDGTHPHRHGANLGIRGDTYRRAGGWGPQMTGEDHDLWARVVSNGCATVATSDIRVTTSGRRIGRAPRGFADALSAHNGTAA